MHHVKRRCLGYLLFIGMLITTSPLLAAAAATVEFVWGTAYAVSISGEKRELEKGSRIDVGDTVVSDTARVQLRFTDGGFVSLAPHSEFRVNAYSYSGKPDGSERLAMELMKGGLRTVSGLIGKAIQSAYEMKTKVATIGIRGTEYTVVYGESVSGTVSAGAVAVCNAGGCLDVTHGQSYYVMNESTKPVFISKAALLSPPQPVIAGERNKDKVAEGESTDAKSAEKGETRSSRGNESSIGGAIPTAGKRMPQKPPAITTPYLLPGMTREPEAGTYRCRKQIMTIHCLLSDCKTRRFASTTHRPA